MPPQPLIKYITDRPTWIIQEDDTWRGVSIDHPADDTPQQVMMSFRIESLDSPESKKRCVLIAEVSESAQEKHTQHKNLDAALAFAQETYNIHRGEWQTPSTDD